MKVSRGDVIIGPDFIGGNNRRPFVVISNENHPFSSEECLVVLITTTERQESISLPEEKFKQGELPKESYASPWTVTTLKTSAVQEKIGKLNSDTLREISDQVTTYIQ
jgi:mRNA-degrading endonuclease toxin of MazEF toxin-antitoxin module